MNLRKIISTVLIAAMLFFAPSVIPARAYITCGVPITSGWLSTDTAFASGYIIPCPPGPVKYAPAWLWAAFACPASIVLSAVVANFRDHRELTTAEAWTCGLLYWIPMPNPPKPAGQHH